MQAKTCWTKKVRGSHILAVSCAYYKTFIANYQKVGESNFVKMYNDRIIDGAVDFSQYHEQYSTRIATSELAPDMLRRWTRKKRIDLRRRLSTRRKYNE